MSALHLDRTRGLFSSLHAWAWRQDENFTTELLAGVLREALRRAPESALRFLGWLAPGFGWDGIDPASVMIRTQSRSLESIPDVQVVAPGLRVDIECKVESRVDLDQLVRHKMGMRTSGERNAGLVLITRCPETIPDDLGLTAHRRWVEVAKQLTAMSWPEPVIEWVAHSMVRFLEERGMAIQRIDGALVSGLSSLQHLLLLIDEAMTALGIRTTRSGGTREIGRGGDPGSVYPTLKQVGVWVQLERPGIVHVLTREVDPEAWKRTPGPGELTSEWWVVPVDLQAEGFFEPDFTVERQQTFLFERIKSVFDFGATIAPLR